MTKEKKPFIFNPNDFIVTENMKKEQTENFNKFLEQLKLIEIGDFIVADSDRPFCSTDGKPEEVITLITKYNEDTGVPYDIICTKDGEYDGRSGVNKNAMVYYIAEIIKKDGSKFYN